MAETPLPATNPVPDPSELKTQIEGSVPHPPGPVGSRQRWLIRLIGILALLGMLLTAGLALLTTTASGLGWGLTLAEHLLPLRVAGVEGRLSDRFRLIGLTLDLPVLRLYLDSVELAWQPWALLSGRLVISHLAIQSLDLRLPPARPDDPPLKLPALILPVAIEIGEMTLKGLRVQREGEDGPLFVLASGELRDGRLAKGSLQIGHLAGELTDPALQLDLEGQAYLVGDYSLTADVSWELDLTSGAALTGTGRLEGDFRRLHLTQTLGGLVSIQLEAQLSELLADLTWDARAQIDRIDLQSLGQGLPLADIQAELSSAGRLGEASLTGRIAFKASLEPETIPLTAQFTSLWQEERLLIQSVRIDTPQAQAGFEGRGALDWSRKPLGVMLAGRWRGLRWPLSGQAIVHSARGSFSAEGDLGNLAYRLGGQISGPDLPAAEFALAGQGNTRATQIQMLVVRLPDGRLEGQGQLTWSPGLAWDFEMAAIGINPGVYAADWPGYLTGRLKTQGAGEYWTLILSGLTGELRGYPFAASAELVARQADGIELKAGELTSGSSRISLNGRISESLDLVFALDAPDLASLWPQAAGRLKLTAHLTGDRHAPAVQLDLKGAGIRLGEQAVAGLEGSAELDLRPQGRVSIRLQGRNLMIGALHWTDLELVSSGTLSDHHLQARLQGSPLKLALMAQGAFVGDGRYRGQVSRLDLEQRDLGRWSLQRPWVLSQEGTRLAVGPLCLRHSKGSAGCLSFEQSAPGRWTLDLELDRFESALLKGVLPAGLESEGFVRIKGRLQAEGPVLSGTVRAEIPRGRLSLKSGQGQVETLDLSNGRLDLNAGHQGLEASLNLPLGHSGQIQGQLSLSGWRLDQMAAPARGRLTAELPDLKPLGALIPEIKALQGGFQAELILDGTLERPVFSGRAKLSALRFQVPLLALKVEDLGLEANAIPDGQLELQGQARLGGGVLVFHGQGQTSLARPWVRLKAGGSRLKLADTREYVVYVEPRLELGLDQEGAKLTGEIRIPEARIRPRALPPGTIAPSRDVTLVSEQVRKPFPLSLDLHLVLGDEVSMDGFGLRGRLAGELDLSQTPGREPLGDGQLQIIDGQYRLTSAFGIAAELGAPLNITQGRLIFAKSPLGNPGLWLQAERQGGGLSAAVQIVGTLRQPKLTFFSETDPGLTQAEITKYLMTGIPPTANDRAEQAGLAVGTYIAPRVYMEYESGLGGSSNRLKLRYDLSKHVEIQAETGAKQGADIFFKLEH